MLGKVLQAFRARRRAAKLAAAYAAYDEHPLAETDAGGPGLELAKLAVIVATIAILVERLT